MRRLLITGGAGFIGTNFVYRWLTKSPSDRVIVLDALTYAGNARNLESLSVNKNFRFVHGDICDENLVAQLLDEERVDTVVHFAAESHVDRSITGPDAFIETNVVGTHTLLKAARSFWLENPNWNSSCRFHHVSTDEVYGSLDPNAPAFTETTSYSPNSPYSASKAGSDHLVRAYHETYGLPVTISNCSNNYGPYQFPEKLIPVILLNALSGKPLPIYGDGENIRDWLYVEDHCAAIKLIIEKGRVGETYNVGGLCEKSNIELVTAICRLLDDMVPDSPHKPHENLITFVEDRPGHDRRYAIDVRKLQTELHWQPLESLESGLRKTLDWYLRNSEWCASCGESGDVSQRKGLWRSARKVD